MCPFSAHHVITNICVTWGASWTGPCRACCPSRTGSQAGRAGRCRAGSRWWSPAGRSPSRRPPPGCRWTCSGRWPGRIPPCTRRCSRPSPTRGRAGRCTDNIQSELDERGQMDVRARRRSYMGSRVFSRHSLGWYVQVAGWVLITIFLLSSFSRTLSKYRFSVQQINDRRSD